MNTRRQLLVAALGLIGMLSACNKAPHDVDFSPGLKSTIPKDSVVVIIDPKGRSVFTDSEGKRAAACTLPELVVKGDTQAAVVTKSTCIGLQKGHYTEQIISDAVIKSFPNPHGCSFCFTRKTVTGAEQICKPDGCESTKH